MNDSSAIFISVKFSFLVNFMTLHNFFVLSGSLRGQRAGPVLETTATETTFGHPKLARPWFPRPVIVNVIDDYSLIQRSLSFEKLASDVRSGKYLPFPE